MAALVLGNMTAFAGTMGPVCMAGNVSVPCASSAWDFGVHALYLKPSYNGELSRGATFTNSSDTFAGITETVVNNSNVIENNVAWTWAFNLEASYHFNTGNDLNLNWYHLSHKTTSNSGASAFSNFFVAPPTFTAVSLQASVEPSWDAVNLEFGQHVDFSEHKKIRFHGGAQYARIHTATAFTGTSFTTTQGLGITSSDVEILNNDITYNGFGPRLGADLSYKLSKGFAVYANGATALLVGKSNFSQIHNNIITTSTPRISDTTDTLNGSRTAIVPELEGKLGLNYTYLMRHGELTFDAGYLWINYFNAQTIAVNDSDFGVQGPFLGVKWGGNFV